MDKYNGFECKTEILDGREMIVVFPESGTENGRWALKTEYFEAFPEVQLRLLSLGYHLVHIKNISRWNMPEDTEARARAAEHMHEKYGLSERCVIIGMSCGGMQGIYFAAKYPEYVSCMYLDAPVVNLLSCPAGLGAAGDSLMEEFRQHTGMDIPMLLGYRRHPLDFIPKIIENKIPVILVCGDSDGVVPYEENGKLINDMYKSSGAVIETIIKPGGDHHPHSLPDNTPIIDFILKYDKD